MYILLIKYTQNVHVVAWLIRLQKAMCQYQGGVIYIKFAQQQQFFMRSDKK